MVCVPQNGHTRWVSLVFWHKETIRRAVVTAKRVRHQIRHVRRQFRSWTTVLPKIVFGFLFVDLQRGIVVRGKHLDTIFRPRLQSE